MQLNETEIAENEIIEQAQAILKKRLMTQGIPLKSAGCVEHYLVLKMAQLEKEVFGCLFINKKNRLIADELLFTGTLNHVSVHPREIVKAALRHNADGVILYHNHPSGEAFPSEVDQEMTKVIKQIIEYVDVSLLDHIIVGGTKAYSFKKHNEL